jgi:hypothetical protein
MSDYPDNNPKTAMGAAKIPHFVVPPSARHALAEAMADGAKKYGPFNWREKRVAVSVYISAALRHIDAYVDGEDTAEDSGAMHLGHAMACLGIIIDAKTFGNIIDDRPLPGAAPQLQREFVEQQKAKAALALVSMDPPTNGA